MAEGRPGSVEDDPDILRGIFPEDLPEHRREPERGIGRNPGGGREIRDGVIRPVEIGVAVNEKETRGRTHDENTRL
jgi:hypothetical protein